MFASRRISVIGLDFLDPPVAVAFDASNLPIREVSESPEATVEVEPDRLATVKLKLTGVPADLIQVGSCGITVPGSIDGNGPAFGPQRSKMGMMLWRL